MVEVGPWKPALLEQVLVPQEILEPSRRLLAGPGEEGFEAIVVWVGRIVSPTTAAVADVVRPAQTATKGPLGCAVEVPPEALAELIRSLERDQRILVRLHTHPGEAFHSDLDDSNMLIAHEGALSVVVPDFARDALELDRCSVNELRAGGRWVELGPDEVQQRFVIS